VSKVALEKQQSPFDLEELEAAIDAAPGPLADARRAALVAFCARGLPDARDEAWRFTSLADVARARFALATPPDAETLDAVDRRLGEALAGLPRMPRVVIVDGFHAPTLSSPDGLPGGVRVESLAAVGNDPDVARLAQLRAGEGSFAALSAAAGGDGVVIRLAQNAVLREPLLVVHVSASTGVVTSPRTIVALARSSQAAVVEVSLALPQVGAPGPVARALAAAATIVDIQDGARLSVARVQLEDDAGAWVRTTSARLGRDAGFAWHGVTLGGRLVRDDLRVLLDAEGAEARLRGLYLARDGQHVDDHVWLEHARPHGTSEQLFKGVISGTGHAVFDGQVHVHVGAQKTNAQQTNRNLLVGEKATVNANPRLTIHADDVKCSHGATVGQLDQDALFYLRSRGLPLAVARGVLTVAFAAETLDGLPAAARPWVEALVRARLAPGEALPS
jgi:Fe-S cluster assembly protein SufD